MTVSEQPVRGGGGIGFLALLFGLVVPGILVYLLVTNGGDLPRAVVTMVTVGLVAQPLWGVLAGVAVVLAVILGSVAVLRGSKLFGVLALVITGATIAVGAFIYFMNIGLVDTIT